MEVANDVACQALVVLASDKDLSVYKEQLSSANNDYEHIGVGESQLAVG